MKLSMTSRANAIIALANKSASPVTDLCYISKIQSEELEIVLSITRTNMMQIYISCADSSWHWNDEKKRKELKGSKFLLLMNSENEKIMAFCSFRFLVDTQRPVLYIYELQVAEGHTGKGIGSEILKKIEKFCVHNFPAIQTVVLTCLNNNIRALSLYSKHGYSRDLSSPKNACYTILSKVIR
jgi:ribosomal protein S18 acetylase RimI-like enzyme